MKADRIVIDTNVLISAALLSTSAPAQLVQWALENTVLLFSPATFDELQTRLWRPKFDRYLSLEQRQSLLHDMGAAALWMTPAPSPMRAFSRDPDDDKFIHLALAGQAAWLVTGDQDLLVLGSIEGVEILTPGQAMEKIERD
ncbi:putative toxin-antitoxin system toxin component, PIN family [Orrella sp. JC864]|uniref:putative toxin-antitoxin system toxin component, PIN family n=1 Tax=Orrella sp. JC864 TaxID=3120298 RepID=UPI0030093E8D